MKNIYMKLLVLLALSVGSISAVQATCTLRGYAVRVAAFPSGIQMYMRPTHTSGYYYRGVTNDPEVASAMFQAYKGKAKINIRSDATVCPVISESGEYFIGVIDIVGLGY